VAISQKKQFWDGTHKQSLKGIVDEEGKWNVDGNDQYIFYLHRGNPVKLECRAGGRVRPRGNSQDAGDSFPFRVRSGKTKTCLNRYIWGTERGG